MLDSTAGDRVRPWHLMADCRSKMEVTDSTKILLNRIQKLEPENATKIIGYILLKHTNQEIMEYAFWNDKQILSLINEAKTYLASSPKPNVSSPILQVRDHRVQNMPFSPTISRPLSSPSNFHVPAPFWETTPASDQIPLTHSVDFTPSYVDLIGGLHKQADFSTSEEHLNSLNISPDFTNNCYLQEALFAGGFGSRSNLRSHTGWADLPTKACHYYYKGFCKHGVNCRFFHGQEISGDFSNMYNSYMNDLCNDDIPFSPDSLEKLEMEIIELLKSKKGMPVSIASLPMMYLEKYGKALQADGYLTESQRHGKSGFSLTRLLAKYSSSIRLIDRPHGQHSVVLVEDSPKFIDYRNERNDQGMMLASSHQIYLTFPAESTFSEDDVCNYFNQYGPVRDVRIPRQEKRMFGFVSFLYPETVKLILSMGHPHYICGARVLVKPYKEKSKLTEKKYMENVDTPVFYPSQFLEMDQNANTMFNMNDNSTFMKRQLIDDIDLAIELERRRLFDLQLIPKQKTPQPYLSNIADNLKFPEDDFNKHLVVSNNDSKSEFIGRQASNNHSHQHSDHIELPDSPFASPRLGNNISGII